MCIRDRPANEAICLNGAFEYSFVKIGEEYHIMATELVKSCLLYTSRCV